MTSGRLEAFSDGVIAILITIMAFELKPPDGTSLASLRSLVPTLLTYLLSFVFLAIYWNNHHHLLKLVDRIDGAVLWANMHLLFWLSLVPFTTVWMGEHYRQRVPVVTYGVVLVGSALAYMVLARRLLALHGSDSALGRALGADRKGAVSLVAYVAALPAAALSTWISLGVYVAVALVWLVPDRRITRVLGA